MDFPYTSTIFSIIAYLKVNKKKRERKTHSLYQVVGHVLIWRCSHISIFLPVFSRNPPSQARSRGRAPSSSTTAPRTAPARARRSTCSACSTGTSSARRTAGPGKSRSWFFLQIYGYILRNFDKLFGILKNSICNIILIKISENLQNSAQIWATIAEIYKICFVSRIWRNCAEICKTVQKCWNFKLIWNGVEKILQSMKNAASIYLQESESIQPRAGLGKVKNRDPSKGPDSALIIVLLGVENDSRGRKW